MDRVILYISTSGTVHRQELGLEPRLVCSTMPVRMGGTRHPRWAGFPTLEAIDEQRTVQALEGKLTKKMANRVPRLVCINCFPADPMVVGVV